MLVVKLELWPFGNKKGKRDLGQLRIVNDGTGTRDLGNYDIALDSSWTTDRAARVENYPREDGAWTLVLESLWTALGGVVSRKHIRKGRRAGHES